MSSFLDSTGLSELATKLKAYFMKKPTSASTSSYPLVGYDATNNVGKYNSDITLDMNNRIISANVSGFRTVTTNPNSGSSWAKIAIITGSENGGYSARLLVSVRSYAVFAIDITKQDNRKDGYWQIVQYVTHDYATVSGYFPYVGVTYSSTSTTRSVHLWVKLTNNATVNTSIVSANKDTLDYISLQQDVFQTAEPSNLGLVGLEYTAFQDGSYPSMTVGTASIARNLPYSIIDKGSQTSKCWKKVATTDVKTGYGGSSLTLLLNYNGYGYSTSNSYALNSFLSLAINSGGSGVLRQGYLHVYHFVNVPTDAVLLRIGSTNQYELWIKANPNNTADVSMIVTKMSQYGNWTFNETTDRNAQLSDTEMTTYQQTNPVVFNGIRYLMSMTTI